MSRKFIRYIVCKLKNVFDHYSLSQDWILSSSLELRKFSYSFKINIAKGIFHIVMLGMNIEKDRGFTYTM